jgi:hypothetical protein
MQKMCDIAYQKMFHAAAKDGEERILAGEIND